MALKHFISIWIAAVIFGCGTACGDVFISEYMAANKSTVLDDNGDSSDWIELHNSGSSAVDLAGWYLSDDLLELRKWRFPSLIIPAGGYELIWASGKNRTESTPLHCSFQLNAEGDSVALVSPDGQTIASSFTWDIPQVEDISCGIYGGVTRYFSDPSPGTVNEPPFILPELVSFSVDSRSFSESMRVSLTSPDDSYEIRYTTDRSEPTASSQLYSSSYITLTQSTMLRAILVDPSNGIVGRIDGRHYSRLSDATIPDSFLAEAPNLESFSSELPIVVIDTFGGAAPADSAIFAPMAFSLYDLEPSGFAHLSNTPNATSRCGMHIRGNSSATFPKKSYRLELQDQNNDDLGQRLCGMTSNSDWVLQAPWIDRALIRNVFAYDLGQTIGLLAPDTQFIELFLNTSGGDVDYSRDYQGVYVLMEVNKRGDGRVEVKKLEPSDSEEPEISGGYIAKFDNASFNIIPDWSAVDLFEPDIEDATAAQKQWLGDYLTAIDEAISATDYAEPEPTWASLLDAPSYINLFVVNELTRDQDAYFRSHYIHKDRNKPLKLGPLWDYNLTCGVGGYRDNQSITGWQYVANDSKGMQWETRLMSSPDFEQQFIDRWFELASEGVLNTSSIQQRIDGYTASLTNAAHRNFAQWNGRNSSWPNQLTASTPFSSPVTSTWEAQLPAMKNWLSDRLDWIGSNFLQPPILVPAGGYVEAGREITIAVEASAYAYTTNGSDPRAPGGAPAASSTLVQGSDNTVELMQKESVWAYHDYGSNLGTAWRESDYDDSSWASGPGQLGYDEGDENTVVSYGPNSSDKFITTFFRHTLVAPDATLAEQTRFELLYDDGAVVYVNGSEVLRVSMPTGDINYTTLANTTRSGSYEDLYEVHTVNNVPWVNGTNVVAVEIHQAITTSSDISFDLKISGSTAQSGQLTIAEDSHIIVRSYDGSNWSAPVEARYFTEPRQTADASSLVISEIHYNAVDDDATEFIEFKNVSPHPMDLSGVQILDAVSFIFPENFDLAPGEYALAVRDSAAFESRYMEVDSPWFFEPITVAGQYTGALNNGGETIRVLASDGSEIALITYDDDGFWPGQADGKGPSLELKNPDNIWSLPAAERMGWLNQPISWQSSARYHGSPGREGALFSGNIWLTELLSHSDAGTDWVEIYNAGDTPVSLTGWQLSDSNDPAQKYSLPDQEPLAAGSYRVYTEAQFNGIGPTAFAFSEWGDEAILSYSSGSNILEIVDRHDFGAAEQEVPFGIHRRSDRNIDFTAMSSPTPGADNAYPLVGPIVISEIQYANTNGYEFIELHNISDQTVPLYDPLHPANTWKLSSAVNFTFPTDIQLAPGGTLVVCQSDAAVFQSRIYVPQSVSVFGPWSGALNNAGETIKLNKPGKPEDSGFVPYILVDRVEYLPYAPWPVLSSNRYSLQRKSLISYGNDPANWHTETVSGGTPGTVDTPAHQGASIAKNQDGVTFSFSGRIGEQYSIESCTNLTDNTWHTQQTLQLTNILQHLEFPSRDRAFFRTTPLPGSP